jgi:hypothetical protein
MPWTSITSINYIPLFVLRTTKVPQKYLWGFTFGKAQTENDNNVYTEVQLVDFALASLYSTKNMKYVTALQLFHLKRKNGHTFTLEDIEQKIFCIDEKTPREAMLSCFAIGSAANSYHNNDSCHKRGTPQNNRNNYP